MTPESATKWISRAAAFGFLIAAAALCLAGYRFYQQQREAVLHEVRTQLDIITQLKVQEMSAWRQERLVDADTLLGDAPLLDDMRAVVTGHASATERERVRLWMNTLCERSQYANAILLDRTGVEHLRIGAAYGDASHMRQLVEQTFAAGGVLLRDLHAERGTMRFHLGLNIALRVNRGDANFGVLALAIDPERYLFPMLDEWPLSSYTGETILARREGDEAFYLNQPDPERGAATRLRVPLSKNELVVVQGVRGRSGLVQGQDRNGRTVLASLRALPNSDWLVVVEVGQDQIVDRVRRRAIPIALVVAALTTTTGLGIFLLWGWQRRRQQLLEQEARREREALSSHYTYLSRTAHDAILLVDDERLIVEANERASEMFGYSHDMLVGMDVARIRSSVGWREFESHWQRAESQQALAFVSLFRRDNGTIFPGECSLLLISVDGRAYHQMVIRDVTQREQERRALENANRLYAVLSHCNQSIVRASTPAEVFHAVTRIVADEGGFQLVLVCQLDANAQRLLPAAAAGPSHGYAEGLDIPLDGSERGRGPAGSAYRLARSVVVDDMSRDERMALWRDRTSQWGLCSAVFTPVLRGTTIIGVLGLYSDEVAFFNQREVELVEEISAAISFALDRLDAEEKRTAADERYRVLVENAPLGVYVHRDLRVVYANRTFVEMIGARAAADIEGRDIYSIVHSDFHAILAKRLEGCAAGETAPLLEERFVRLDGSVIDVDVLAVPIELEAERAVLVFCVDITQRKKAEAERAAMQEQFLQAQKMETVGRLAGGVAHDFNNHLTVINGYCDLLLGELAQGNPMRDEIAGIRKAGEQAAKLTRQLLTFSRKQVTESRVLNLNDVVTEAKTMLSRLIGEHIRIETRLSPDLGAIEADPTQLQQVLMNLAINARDAMPAGGVLLIETDNFESDKPHPGVNVPSPRCVRLRVSDSGVGMDDQTRRLAFEPFFTTKARGIGTGLGLATVYAVVSQAGGCIDLHTAPGEGATFLIYFPRAASGAGPSVETSVAPRATTGKETILLVEDQSEVRKLTATILRGLGYRVVEAEGGEQALELMPTLAGAIDMLLTDVVMPGLTGPQLAAQIRHALPSLKVLYVSGYSADIPLGDGHADETIHRLSKPFSPASLAAKVREVLDE